MDADRSLELDETAGQHLQELRRGTVALACLLRLRTPDYGWSLLETLNADGLDVDTNTLYPLLRRLEKQGLVTSAWNTDEARPRKFYAVSPAGERLAALLAADWHRLDAALRRLMKDAR